MYNVTHKVYLKLSHEALMLNLAKPCLNLWCMPCVQVHNISIIYLFIVSQNKLMILNIKLIYLSRNYLQNK